MVIITQRAGSAVFYRNVHVSPKFTSTVTGKGGMPNKQLVCTHTHTLSTATQKGENEQRCVYVCLLWCPPWLSGPLQQYQRCALDQELQIWQPFAQTSPTAQVLYYTVYTHHLALSIATNIQCSSHITEHIVDWVGYSEIVLVIWSIQTYTAHYLIDLFLFVLQ